MTRRKPLELGWNDFIERQIQDAQAAGEFEALPGLGQPLPLVEDAHDENWWLKRKLKRERLSVLPPGLQIRLDVENGLRAINQLPDERTVRRAVEELNEKIDQANHSVTWGPPSTTMPLDADLVIAKWRERFE